MHIIATGLSHKTAPVEIRETLAVTVGKLAPDLDALRQQPGVGEGVIVSTCNRTEVYASLASPEDGVIERFLASRYQVDMARLGPHLYRYLDREAVSHLFRVASGTDSMAVGEYQILGQVKQALTCAQTQGTAGAVLGQLFQTALAVGKRARGETEIGAGAFSVAGCAVALARQIFDSLGDKRILILGAGEMAEATARTLQSAGAPSVFVANRTFDRAQALAGELGGQAVRFDDLESALSAADIVVASTASPHAVVHRELVARAMRRRRNLPLFLIDIAVPRDVEPAVGRLDNVYLYDIDDLQAVVAEDTALREREIEKVEAIVQQEADRFMGWFRSLAVTPTIQALQAKLEGIRRQELERAASRLGGLSPEQREAVERLTRSIVEKTLHSPAIRLRRDAENGERIDEAAVLRALFEIEEGEEGSP
jgi:glutamyl-tRNA reductase